MFSFNDDFSMICDLNNYKDLEHYGDWVNRSIFENMRSEKGRLTAENIDLHFDALLEFYSKYDYDTLFIE